MSSLVLNLLSEAKNNYCGLYRIIVLAFKEYTTCCIAIQDRTHLRASLLIQKRKINWNT